MKSFVQHRRGRTPRQAHVDLEGLKDDELGRGGFGGRHAQLYRRNDPTRYKSLGDYRPRRGMSYELTTDDATDPRALPTTLLENADCRIGISRRASAMPFYVRNVVGDELFFVHRGTGTFETEMGSIPYEPGDYVVIPKAITYRVVPEGEDSFFFVVQTSDELLVPDYGALGRHAPFDPTLLFVPEPRVIEDAREWEVLVVHPGGTSSITYPHDPCDVEGWKGDLFPFKLNIRDWNVIASDTLHLPPSVHQFLGSRGVVVCTFLPHRAPSRMGAERVPWYHRNADYDEVTFYHGGNFLGAPLPPGLIEHAPQGVHHGAPEIAREMARKTHAKVESLEWKIVCIETSSPLRPTDAFRTLAGG